MTSESLTAWIAGLPKAELHVHHVGSASPRIVSGLAERHPGTVPADPELLRDFFAFRDFAHFIEVYLAVVDLVRTGEDLRYLTYEVAREMAQGQSLRYAELTCTPFTSVAAGIPIEAYVEAIEDARAAAERDFGLVLRWIYDIPGESGLPAADDTLRYALEHAPDGLIGFGLGGPEQGVPRPQFEPHFAAARAAGLRSVPHAGETTGRDRLARPTAAGCRADRPRHLRRSRPGAARVPRRDRDPARGLPVVQRRHPGGRLPRRPPAPPFVAAGVTVTINSDDPPMFGTDLNQEYGVAARLLGLDARVSPTSPGRRSPRPSPPMTSGPGCSPRSTSTPGTRRAPPPAGSYGGSDGEPWGPASSYPAGPPRL